jgi:hypothetical protein
MHGGNQQMAEFISSDLKAAADRVAEACRKLQQSLSERNYLESDGELVDFLRVQLQGGEDQLRSIAEDVLTRDSEDG